MRRRHRAGCDIAATDRRDATAVAGERSRDRQRAGACDPLERPTRAAQVEVPRRIHVGLPRRAIVIAQVRACQIEAGHAYSRTYHRSAHGQRHVSTAVQPCIRAYGPALHRRGCRAINQHSIGRIPTFRRRCRIAAARVRPERHFIQRRDATQRGLVADICVTRATSDRDTARDRQRRAVPLERPTRAAEIEPSR